jgi:Fe-Mn family superoxide dismutase
MTHLVKDFSHLLGTLLGLSDAQLQAHFGLYQGYVKKLNEIEEKLKTMDRALANYTFGEFSELKRRECTAFNGSYLHQMYFENLTGKATEVSPELKAAVDLAFGSWEDFEKDLKASAGSTPGWVLLTWNQLDQSLHTYVMYEHHVGLPIHQVPILALDCWEHAFMIDYGTNKAAYLEAFLKNVDWQVVSDRFNECSK